MIPLGIMAVAGRPLGAYELITSSIITSATSPVVIFSSIPQDYQHLELRIVGRFNSSAAANRRMSIYLNGYNGVSNNAFHMMQGNGTTVSASSSFSVANISAGYIAMNNYPANVYSASIINILDYASTTKNKTIRQFGGVVSSTATNSFVTFSSGFKNDLPAVTSLELSSDDGAILWMAGSRVSLYGVR